MPVSRSFGKFLLRRKKESKKLSLVSGEKISYNDNNNELFARNVSPIIATAHFFMQKRM